MPEASAMNYAQMNLDIFTGKDPGGVLWQPRIDFWYSVNKKRGKLPHHLRGLSLEEVYDYCHASIRYFSFPLRRRFTNVQITDTWENETNQRITWETPIGTLTELLHWDELKTTRYHQEYLLKTPNDFKIYEFILHDEEWYWDQAILEKDQQRVGNRGALHYWSRRSPIQSLFIETMGFENTIFFMQDHPKTIERILAIQDEADDAMYAVICQSPTPIFNLGDNIDHHMDSPRIWRNYLAPNYAKRAEKLHAAGIYTTLHVDGSMKSLIRELRESPLDGVEACTPSPQGDVSVAEIKQALGDRVLLDGIPAIYFLPSYPIEDMLDSAREVVSMFYPHLALGISDELPPDSDIERVRLVGELAQEWI